MTDKIKIQLTDEEWMSIIDSTRDGLSPCCANISDLRDTLTASARIGGGSHFGGHSTLLTRLAWCFPEHGEGSQVLQKVMAQVGFVPKSESEHPVEDEFAPAAL